MKKNLVQGSIAIITDADAKKMATQHGIRTQLVQVMEVRNDIAYVAENHVYLSAKEMMSALLSDETDNKGVRMVTWKSQVDDGYSEDYRMPLVPIGLEHLEVR